MTVVLALGVLALTIAVLVHVWLLVRLTERHLRIARQMDAAVRRLAEPIAATSLAPHFVLPTLDGRSVALRDLLATGKRTLLTFTDPRCGPCYESLADVGGWERVYGDRLAIATVSSGDLRQNEMLAREYGLGTVLLQQDREVAEAFEMKMLPAAVLIEPDGRVAETANGADGLRQLAATALGLAVPTKAQPEIVALQPGQPVGDLRRPDLDGNSIALGDRHPTPTLLLFWSTGCSHCQDLLPALRAWDAEPNGWRLIVATSGPAELNRDVGLHAPMIQADDKTLQRTFGVAGTPAAVLIDGEGRVASKVARGATAVQAIGERIFGRPPVAA